MTPRLDRHPRPRRRERSAGQSVVEFAIILPVMLALLGAIVDFSQVYDNWITLQAAGRDAAERAASQAATSAQAQTLAKDTVCSQSVRLRAFSAPPGNPSACTTPTVTVTAFSVSTTAPGASTKYPVGSATVEVAYPFRPLFTYPFLGSAGTWTITTRASFQVIQGR